MNMIEKVARATHKSIYGSDVMWRESIPAARAAIEAMMEPSEEMVEAANGADLSNGDGYPEQIIYQAMLRAALEEK